MRKSLLAPTLIALALAASPANALYEGLQCVPFARALTGVTIFGDAHTWWNQAEGRYQRGDQPKVGAVMAFRPHGNMRLGHVAAVRKVIDKRTLLISHANWSTIDGMRGHIEEDVRVIDVSEDNDWSRVRVWYTPNSALGGNEWPLHGFIYPEKTRKEKEARAALAAVLAKTPPSRPSAKPAVLDTAKPERPAVRFATASAPKTAAKTAGFTLSTGLLSEIDNAAKKEAKRARKS
ncbi:CHAP domain-containing protein [Sphingorhabdus pulchriflava]|uniref:CHAP domain-containing protein n=1 Tax=Sphingorhabdus pulchriflava TaxID=2292257 RepID=A0A371B5L2_9SPHN|nr:CHAP domain-containing protein [Sphingorhabdus pulchriflava]RDV02733.1 CHAP domain-containing protein [Sphingorhabdus pulchriflava]